MLKTLLRTFLCIFILIAQQVVWADTLGDNSQTASLSKRISDWPEWHLPGPFNSSKLKQDIKYPEFFFGTWDVISIDLNKPESEVINYLVKFKHDSLGNVIGDRNYNTQSIGKKIFGDNLLSVNNDLELPNRQIAIFKDSEYLETKIIGRNQEMTSNGRFITDELALQIYHSSSASRINQIETLSQYNSCKDLGISILNFHSGSICGEQWQAMYKEPGDSLFARPVRINHFRLILVPQEDQISLKYFLNHLSNEKEFSAQDDH